MFVKRSWCEINLSAIKDNCRILQKTLGNSQDMMAVVKANAYGHGDSYVAKALQEVGVNFFAVASIKEAIDLRNAGVCNPILILGYTPVEFSDYLVKYDLTQAIISEEYAEKLSRIQGIKVHIAIDTGMKRIGIDSSEVEDCEIFIRDCYQRFNVLGIFTHLCAADDFSKKSFTDLQIKRFYEVVNRVSDLNIPFIHVMNSAGALEYKEIGNLVRYGIVLYGLKPNSANTLPAGITPVMTWKTVVSLTKKVKKGEPIGYSCSYCAENDMIIAVLPTGYADGYSRALSNKGYVLIRGKKAPIIGKICMDQMMVDITHIKEVSFGEEAVLIGKSENEIITADDIATISGTIGYEVVCAISGRVDRIYVEE